MHWGKIINGELQYAPPEIYYEDGSVRELLSYDDYVYEGYKRIIRKKPTYDPATEYLILNGFIEEEKDIYILYEIKDIN